MADLFPIIASRILPRLGQSPGLDGGVRTWFLRGSYIGGIDPITGNVVLSNVHMSELVEYFAFDFERFCLSSLESFYVSKSDFDSNGFISWPLLKLYYSAFFSAHAIMRATGCAIVKIEREQIDAINMMVQTTTGTSPRLKPGMFRCTLREVMPGQNELVISSPSDGVGVHDAFWKTFCDYLDEIAETAVQNGSPDASQFVAGISNLSPKLRGWLSARRNDINYQQLFGVWYPLSCGRKIKNYVSLVGKIKSKSVNINMDTTKTIECFIRVSQFMACLNVDIGDYVCARSSATRAFGSRWKRFPNF
mgnify:CR=1 FL=1